MGETRRVAGLAAVAGVVLLLAGCVGRPTGGPEAGAASERVLSGRELYDQAEQLEDIQVGPGGLALARGVLIEDDGPAFGVFDPAAEPGRAVRKAAASLTDTPYWEFVTRTTWARKTLLVGPVSARSATLWVFAARTGEQPAPLVIQVNGKTVTLNPSGPASIGPRWLGAPVDPATVHAGENEVILRTELSDTSWAVLIAPQVHYGRGGAGRRTPPGHSVRTGDGGRTWQSNKLGRDSIAAGEYAIRLHLDQHAVAGTWTGPVVDLYAAGDEGPVRRQVVFKQAAGQVVQSLPRGGRVDWEFRSGSLEAMAKEAWGPWARLSPDSAGRFVVPGPVGRYGQLRAMMFTEDPSVSPVVRSVRLGGQAAEPAAVPPGLLRVTFLRNPAIVRGTVGFAFETVPSGRLAALDQRYELGSAVKGALTQFDQATRVLAWLGRRARRGLFLPGQAWNAPDILATQTDGPTWPLPYHIVLCQGLLARGMTARIIFFAQPTACRSAVEFWSTDYNKWVLMDGQGGRYFIDAATNLPLDGLELHERFIAPGLAGDRTAAQPTARQLGVRAVGPEGLMADDCPVEPWPAGDLLVMTRNNFASADRPLPLNPEWTGPGWTEFVAWGRGQAAGPWLARHADRRRDLYWTVNQARMEVQHGKSPGELWVHLDTVCPSFDTFQANVDDTGYKAVPAGFQWLLVPGPNNLKVRARNKAGAVGPASSMTVEFFPPGKPPG